MGQRYHYLYKIIFPTRGWHYYGIHSTYDLSDGYMGSPQTHKDKWAHHDCHKVIVQYFDTRKEAMDMEHRVLKHTKNDPYSLNEHCGGGFSLEVCRQAGKKGGKAAVESGQLAAARMLCDTPERRRKCGEAIRQYNASRDPEWWREQSSKGGKAAAEATRRPCWLINQTTGETLHFESVKLAATTLGLHQSNLYNILNNKRSNPHKGWSIYTH